MLDSLDLGSKLVLAFTLGVEVLIAGNYNKIVCRIVGGKREQYEKDNWNYNMPAYGILNYRLQ